MSLLIRTIKRLKFPSLIHRHYNTVIQDDVIDSGSLQMWLLMEPTASTWYILLLEDVYRKILRAGFIGHFKVMFMLK